jgi:hypothetical protein
MREPDPLISLGLTKPGPEQLPPVEELQFRRAQPLATGTEGTSADRSCIACKQPIADDYYHAQGQVVCPLCAERIQTGQQRPPSISLIRSALYGGAAAFAGFVIYALVAIVTGLEIGLIAILVGIMVGKAIRYASRGLGGRPQQVLAVALTYFAITTSYIPVVIYHVVKSGKTATAAKQAVPADSSQQPAQADPAQPRPTRSLGTLLLYMVGLVMAAPFVGLFTGSNVFGSLISLFIIYIGLQRAWALTGRTEIFITGPYKLSAP